MSDDQTPGCPPLPRRTLLKLAGAAGVGVVLPLGLVGCGDDAANVDAGGTDAARDGASPDAAPMDAGRDATDATIDAAPLDGGDAAPGDGGDAAVPVRALTVPTMLEGELLGGVRNFRLELQTGSVEWVAGNPTATYGVNGPFLGPTLHYRRGERVRIEVTNSLSEVATLHWHGMQLPAQSDGGPYQTIAPGETWVSEYDVIQPAMMAWYHPHQMGQTGRQVYMGMAGLIYLEDPDLTVALPTTYGVDDIPLAVQDRRFAADGTHPYSAGTALGMRDRMAGLKGETILVNGVITPRHRALKGLVRLRILNASNARNYNFGFSDDRMFQYIGGDGGLFESSVETNRVALAPAERADILVDFGADATGSIVGLRSYSGEVVDLLFAGGMASSIPDAMDRDTFDIMSFEVGEPPASVITPPTSFDPIARLTEADAVRTRVIALSMGGGEVFINGEQMLDTVSVPDAINYRIASGDVEIWHVLNSSAMAHPLHIHHRHFQVLDIEGAAPPVWLAGHKDTIQVPPGQSIRLLLKFEGTVDLAFPYMFHCHILEHEDDGMMGQFYIV